MKNVFSCLSSVFSVSSVVKFFSSALRIWHTACN